MKTFFGVLAAASILALFGEGWSANVHVTDIWIEGFVGITAAIMYAGTDNE